MNNKRSVKIFGREISRANILRVAAGTTGFCGGDTGHGGRTYIELEDLGSTDVTYEIEEGNMGPVLKISLGGDSELVTIIEAFEFIIEVLRRESGLMNTKTGSFKTDLEVHLKMIA